VRQLHFHGQKCELTALAAIGLAAPEEAARICDVGQPSGIPGEIKVASGNTAKKWNKVTGFLVIANQLCTRLRSDNK